MIRLFAGFKNRLRQKRGQGMTEYIIIVALIAVGSIAIVSRFGANVQAMFKASANAIAGNTNVDVTALGAKQVTAGQEKTLATFGQNADAP
jgi:pilus assembly protein Flp/PilA